MHFENQASLSEYIYKSADGTEFTAETTVRLVRRARTDTIYTLYYFAGLLYVCGEFTETFTTCSGKDGTVIHTTSGISDKSTASETNTHHEDRTLSYGAFKDAYDTAYDDTVEFLVSLPLGAKVTFVVGDNVSVYENVTHTNPTLSTEGGFVNTYCSEIAKRILADVVEGRPVTITQTYEQHLG